MRVVFIAGERDSGKTGWCRRHLTSPDTDGVLLEKVYRDAESPPVESAPVELPQVGMPPGTTRKKPILPKGMPAGYDAVHLRTGERVPFLRLARPDAGSHCPAINAGAAEANGSIGAAERIGRYAVNLEGRQRANRWIREALAGTGRAVLIDEVGRLEIRNGGFSGSVSAALAESAEKTLYLVVRSEFVSDIMSRFAISRAVVWEIESGNKVRERLIPPT